MVHRARPSAPPHHRHRVARHRRGACSPRAVVAVVTHALLPSLPWAACAALGAIVSPPDAVSARAVLQRVQLPRRLSILLEGESLLNDASGLVLFRFAVAAAVTGTFSAVDALGSFSCSRWAARRSAPRSARLGHAGAAAGRRIPGHRRVGAAGLGCLHARRDAARLGRHRDGDDRPRSAAGTSTWCSRLRSACAARRSGRC